MAISRNMMERQLRAGGGIMTLEEPRQGYFLGKIVKKAKRAVKKVVKSPLGKIALAAVAANYAPMLLGKQSLLTQAGGFSGLPGLFARSKLGTGLTSGEGFLGQIGNVFRVGGDKANPFSALRLLGGAAGLGAVAAPFLMGGDDEEEIDPGVDVSGIQPMVADIRNQAKSFYTNPLSRADSGLYFMPRQEFIRPFADGGLADIPREGYDQGKLVLGEGFKSETLKRMAMDMFGKPLRELNADEMEMLREEFNISKGITEAKEGGIMDLGGMEKDYREGGFVPIGAEERADDVPARLSKNEFVFTADAVRNAGQGDIDKGAEVMQNMMDNLEAGGTISEESQGIENPAQEMFNQAQMLESRIA
jgi:hypothetical protein